MANDGILVVDDEKNIRRTLRMVLEGEGYVVSEAASAAEASTQFKDTPSAILLDVKLGSDDGLELLEQLKASHTAVDPDTPVIMISGHATISDAVRATKLGAFDFLEKPLDRNRVVVTVRNACERWHMTRQVMSLRNAVDSRYELLGEAPVMHELRRQIAKVAPTKTRVLVTGDSGTGKELIARAIHRNSAVADGPFVKVNCAAIAPELIESELFGHERGAFTGAIAKKRGLFEVADKGTIFLDEIGDMSLSAQAKVLRVLQTGDFTRVGGETTLSTDCRVVAATNKDLQEAVANNEFREDLFFRLNVVPIHSPRLCERVEDIPLLVEAFIADCCSENGFSHKRIDDIVIEKLKAYDWPGNVRELRNVAERLVIMSDDVILERDIPAHVGGSRRTALDDKVDHEGSEILRYADKSLREFREAVESDFIRYKLGEHGWNISKTAQILGIERTNLHKRMRSLGIHRENK